MRTERREGADDIWLMADSRLEGKGETAGKGLSGLSSVVFRGAAACAITRAVFRADVLR